MTDRDPLLGLIAGTSLLREPPFVAAVRMPVTTPFGEVVLQHAGPLVLVSRHGSGGRRPAHRVHHQAHIYALRKAGVLAVVSLCSVGSLRPALVPGTLVVPDDYGQFLAPPTFFDDRPVHVTPTLDEPLRARLLRLLRGLKLKTVDGGVYWQTAGPRLETRAEVRMLAGHADVVGMTFASEATLCHEVELPVAAVCAVDNMAHGITGGEAPSGSAIDAAKRAGARRWARVAGALAKDVEALT